MRMNLAITGWSVLTSAGIGRAAFASVADSASGPHPPASVQGLYSDPLPNPCGHALVTLDVRKELGRKGTSSIDRRTVLALIACRDALSDARLEISPATCHRVGVALGTTWGSLQAMSDYTKDSLLEERPYLVEPARFPNTVMNCASGQAAIRFGLKGANATIAGGRIAFFSVLEYTNMMLRRNYADTILAGAVEEFTPHTAWARHLLGDQSSVPAGEAAAVFVVERDGDAPAGRGVVGRVRSAATAYVTGPKAAGALSEGLARCIRRALDQAEAQPADVAFAVTMEGEEEAGGCVERIALASLWPGPGLERAATRTRFGDCSSATGALQLGMALVRSTRTAGTRASVVLMTGWTDDGGVAAAVLEA
jgi:3-oxoacyl-[acyl-carrier-protein] synthase II